MSITWSLQDIEFMHAALADAALAADANEIPVGAVVVADGEIVAMGHNSTIADSDPSGHAEIIALPCVMCVGAIAQARVGRVVFGAYDKKAGALGSVEDLSDSQALNHRFEVNGGLLADECGEVLRAFFASRR